MPIEFACENCARLLRVPDGSSGKKSQCPACFRSQEIPYVITSRDPEQSSGTAPAKSGTAPAKKGVPPGRASDDGSVRESVSGQQSVTGQLSIPCPNCRHHLVCSSKLIGTRGQCRMCQHIFTIATEPDNAPQHQTSGLVFSCPECRQLFEGKSEMAGRNGRCHVCQAVFTIELRRAEPATSPAATPAGAQTHASALETKKGQPKQAAPHRATQSKPKKPIQFICSRCHGVMEVPGSSAGLDTACPYCQTVQRIPAHSTSPGPSPNSRQSPAPELTNSSGTYNSLALPFDSLVSVNPYAVAPQSNWLAPARSRHELKFGNVFAIAFENLFPSCLFTVVHTIVAMCAGLMLIGFFFTMLYLFASLKLGQRSNIVAIVVLVVLITPFAVAIGAWFSSSIRHMALLAVRGRPFDASKAISPGGAYNVALLIAFINLLMQMVTRAPQLIDKLAPGTVGLLALPLVLAVFVLTVLFTFSTSLAWFAAIDGDDVGEAISTSFRLLFSNFLVMCSVKIVVWFITVVLMIPTLGLSLALPVYFNAVLYHLARSSE